MYTIYIRYCIINDNLTAFKLLINWGKLDKTSQINDISNSYQNDHENILFNILVQVT